MDFARGLDPDPWGAAMTRVSTLGSVARVDVNRVGSAIPGAFARFRARDSAPDAAVKEAWVSRENAAVVEGLSAAAGRHGGDFGSFAEWTVTDHWFHMHFGSGDGGIRARRAAAFGPDYRAAISSLNWLHPDCLESGRLQATAFVATRNRTCSQRSWRPSAMADYERFVVAPAVVTEWDDVRLVHIAGVLGVDPDFTVVAPGNPEAQIRHVLRTIIAVAAEAGGGRSDVIRLRPFVNDAAMAETTRSLVDELWKGAIPPAVIVADDMRFSADSPFHIECQAAVLIGADHRTLSRDGRTVVRESRRAGWRWLEAAQIAAPASPAAAQAAAAQAAAALRSCRWGPEHASVVFAYAGGPSAHLGLEGALQAAGFPRESLHVVPSREMTGDAVRLSIIATRSDEA